ncbi:biotin-dependent carboxyltransferase family protein [Dermacoccaceae bacterium W4C1]
MSAPPVEPALEALEVTAVTGRWCFQDGGRPGHSGLGVGPAGAVDRSSYRRAAALVGSTTGATVLEGMNAAIAVRALRDVTVVATGAPSPMWVDDASVRFDRPVQLAAGSMLRIDAPRAGLWTYLAVSGGFAAAQVLGSASVVPTAGIGSVLRPGEILCTTRLQKGSYAPDLFGTQRDWVGPVRANVMLGPRHDLFTASARQRLFRAAWRVGTEIDRVGMRLRGPALTLAEPVQLPSEPTVRGAIQVPPDGRPVVFLADHPVTGGYPVIGVIADDDQDAVAQAEPGRAVWFSPAPPGPISG